MVTSAKAIPKKASPAAPKAAAKPAAKPVTKTRTQNKAKAGAEPFVRFYHSTALRNRMHATLGALEQASNPEKHRDDLADLVDELTEAGMDYYFLRGLQSAKMGFVAEQSAKLGLLGAVKLITTVSRKFIVRMDSAQLMAVSRHIRELTI